MEWYQEAIINGVVMPTQRKSDTSQKRWETYIKPLLPMNRGLFIDLGCNAGAYMRWVVDLGFSAIGVEVDDEYIKHARYWEKHDPKGVTIIHKDICKFDIPACQVALLGKVHYWLGDKDLKKLIKKLKERALYVIVVGRHKRSDTHKSACDLDTLRKNFSDFKELKVISGRKHYSVIFKNPDLVEKYTIKVFNNQPLVKSRKFLKCFSDFIDNNNDPYKSEYYKYLLWRRFKNPKDILKGHINLIKDVRKHGIKKPLILGRMVHGKYKKDILTDGDHRIIIAKKLGIKKVICKILNKPK